jgi:excisionase family DNA binding protein
MEAVENGNGKTFTPIEIKPKTSIRIHHTPNSGREYFTVSYYDEDGKRQRRQFRDLVVAQKEANKLAGKIGKNEAPGLLVTGRDRLIYERALFSMPENTSVSGQDAYWRKTEVASFCRVGVRTIENWMAHQGFPHIKIGNVVLFKKEDVKGFLERKRRVLAD